MTVPCWRQNLILRSAKRVSKDEGHQPGHMVRDAASRLLTMRSLIYLYESGSGESDGLANSFFSSGPIGTLRFSPFGGIFCVNHLS